MKIKVIGTGSSGNSYVLKDMSSQLMLLDVGLPIKDIKVGINFRVCDLVGGLCTHTHNDHDKSANDLIKMGIPIYQPYADEKPIELRSVIPFASEYTFKTIPMKSPTDDTWLHTNGDGTECPCYGFIIEHPEMGRLLYITDAMYVPYRFKNIDHVLLGVNYSSEYLETAEDSKSIHVYQGHMNIETACQFISELSKTNDLKNVIMCHLSDINANADNFIEHMSKVVNCPIYVAKKGMEIELRKED